MPSPGPLDALIFDMDGTLIDSYDVIVQAYAAAVHAVDARSPARSEILTALPSGPVTAILARLLSRPATSAEGDIYHRELAARSPEVAVYPGIRDALVVLSGILPMAIFTGAATESCRILLGGAGLLHPFELIVGGDEVAHPKPHPDGVLLACRRLRVHASRAAYVGDAPYDLEAARRAGAFAVAAAWGELFDATAEADVVVQRPADLASLVEARSASDGG